MPKHQVTYGQMMALRDDIHAQQNQSAAFYYFQKSKCEKFFSLNAMALKILQSRMDEFVKKYVKFDKDAQPITEEKDGKTFYTFYTEEAKDEYIKATNHFLSLPTTIEI